MSTGVQRGQLGLLRLARGEAVGPLRLQSKGAASARGAKPAEAQVLRGPMEQRVAALCRLGGQREGAVAGQAQPRRCVQSARRCAPARRRPHPPAGCSAPLPSYEPARSALGVAEAPGIGQMRDPPPLDPHEIKAQLQVAGTSRRVPRAMPPPRTRFRFCCFGLTISQISPLRVLTSTKASTLPRRTTKSSSQPPCRAARWRQLRARARASRAGAGSGQHGARPDVRARTCVLGWPPAPRPAASPGAGRPAWT